MTGEKRFWMVWSPQGSAPSVKHPTLYAAKQEADRLARKHTGREFVVLQSVGVVRTRETEWVEHEAESHWKIINNGITGSAIR